MGEIFVLYMEMVISKSRSSKVKRVRYAQVRLGYEINANGSKLSPFLKGEIFALNM